MTQETKNILQNMPYNSYEDLFSALYCGKAKLGLSLSACRQIAATKKPMWANCGMHLGIIPSAALTIWLSIYCANYWLLLLLPLELTFSLIIYTLRNFHIKPWPIAAIILFIDLFLMKMPLFMLIITVSWLINCWVCRIWQKKVYKLSVEMMQHNEDAFVWAFNSHNLVIEDCFGNAYNKVKLEEAELEAYERLLKILEIGAGVKDIDDAIKTFFLFYQKKGKNLSSELLWGKGNGTLREKQEALLSILEAGMDVVGIEAVTSKLLDFYKSKGITFPDNL